jgi:hypothetical protein
VSPPPYAQFGRRSEKLDPEQLLLALEDIEQAIAGNEAADDKEDPVAARARGDKRRANRGALATSPNSRRAAAAPRRAGLAGTSSPSRIAARYRLGSFCIDEPIPTPAVLTC